MDELYAYSSDSESFDEIELDDEEWQDWNSEELLDLWMSIVEYHEDWYLPLNRTFNQFCEFIKKEEYGQISTHPPEIQETIKNHPMIKGRDWDYFFSLSYK